MKTFYFTFGSDHRFPFCRGWIEIHAENKAQACAVFRAYFPDKNEGILNCAFVYGQEEWDRVKSDFDVPGEFCHGVIRFNPS